MSTFNTIAAVLTVALLLTTTARLAQGQQASCASALVPCAEYLNSTNPPATCCDAIRQVVQTQLPCLCNLYNTPGLLSSMGINATQALELPKHCGLPSDLSACNAAPGSSPPGRVPGGSSGGSGGGNGVGTISWSAMPALLLVWGIGYIC